MPEVNNRIYSTASGYEDSARNLSRITLETDPVFSDSYGAQLPADVDPFNYNSRLTYVG